MIGPDLPSPLYFDAELTPNKSLSPRAFSVVMIVVAALSFLAGIAFLLVGAIPVVGFFGLDALAIWLAFRWSFKQQRQMTRIRINRDVLRVDHRQPNGDETSVELPSAFVRIELEKPLKPQHYLQLAFKQERWIIGRFLTPEERESLADALQAALMRARSLKPT